MQNLSYYYDQIVSITCATPDATIKYTLDGSAPSQINGILYSAPITISQTSTVKAIAYKSGFGDSAITTAEYIMLPPPQPRTEPPQFAPAAGTYADPQTVTLTCATDGATIKYTLDGSIPNSKNGTIYKNPINVTTSTTIKAYAYKKFIADSEIITAVYEILPPAANPQFTPVAGTYGPGLSVTITCATDGATIKYTTDGTNPSAVNGFQYSAPLTINQTTTIKAIAIKSGIRDSQIVSAVYEILPPVADPQFSPAAGTYADPQTVTLTCATAGATIKYTLDGSVPTDKHGTTYKNPFTVSSSVTVKAFAFKKDMTDSNIISASYEILPPAANPQFTPVAGTYGPGLSVTITCATDGATIKYTTDGTNPSLVNGFQYSAPLTINQTTTIKAIAIKSGIRDSQIVSAVYEILAPVADPQFSPAAGTYADPQTVTLTCATAGATIKYTLDGSVPTDKNGTTYRNPFTVSASVTVKAIAFKNGMADSNIVSASYEILPPAANPQFIPQAGAYSPGLSVTITCATDGATVKYTTDGTDPSLANGFEYSAPLTINQTTTIKAIAIKAGIRDSQVVSAVYEILTPVADPQFSPAAGTYSGEQTINLTTATKNANIKYTLDGTDPSPSNGIVYKKSFVITESTTIKAYAYKSGLPDSQIVTAEYIINP